MGAVRLFQVVRALQLKQRKQIPISASDFCICFHFFSSKEQKMAAALVGGAFLSATLQVLFDRMASGDFIRFFQGQKIKLELLKKLKMTLLTVDVVLDDAEEKQIMRPRVREWLDELKDAVYDAEDLLDEIAAEALRCKLEADSQTSTNQVGKLTSTFANPFGQGIESKIEKVVDRLEFFAKQKDVLGLKQGVGGWPLQRWPTTSLVDETTAYGRDNDKEEILKLLLSGYASGREVSVISIVGMGGVGKTTLAQLLYNDAKVDDHFEFKAWVFVSEEFDVFRITKTILESFTSETHDVNDFNLLQSKLRDNLMGRKFLLVLDDVWNENYNNWDVLKSPFKVGASGSKIVATMRNRRVASIMHPSYTHHLGQLSHDDCWMIFSKHAFENGNPSAHPNLEVIGKQIVRKCDGLPLGAKALGGLLSSTVDVKEWERVLNSEIWDLPDNSILPALRLSYHYLPKHLKPCFAYCSIFPKGYEYNKEELVLLWIAEGFVHEPKVKRTMEVLGDKYFSDLLSRSFFQQSSGNKLRFVMHDLMNDLAQTVSGEFFSRLEAGKLHNVSRNTRHLSYVRGKYDGPDKFGVLAEIKCLRTFLQIKSPSNCGDCYLSNSMICDLLSTLRHLKVLSLSRYLMNELPNSIGKLEQLRYLDLSYTAIRRLPDSTSNLYNLQMLMLKNCRSLSKLPANMSKLINLSHLDITRTNIKEMPVEMSRLKDLQMLTTFVVGKHSGSRIKELGALQHLQGNLSILNLQNVAHAMDAFKADLKRKEHIDKLVFEWSGETDDSQNERNVLEKLLPHTNLKKLAINSYGGTRFPEWLGDPTFSNIVFLCLSNCKNCWLLPPLGQLSSLKDLSLIGIDGVTRVGPEFYGTSSHGSPLIRPFGSLSSLRFERMPEWEEWLCWDDEEQFPLLKQLYVLDCPKLKGDLPKHLPLLMRLNIFRCPELVASLPQVPSICYMHLSDSSNVVLRSDNGQTGSSNSQFVTLSSIVGLKGLPCLKILHISGMSNLKKLPEGLQNISSLRELKINACPNLLSLAEVSLPSRLATFLINACGTLVSLPEGMNHGNPHLRCLHLRDCSSLEFIPRGGLPTTLKEFSIRNCPNLELLLSGETMHRYTALETLIIDRSCDSLRSFPVGVFPNLQLLHLLRCLNLKHLFIPEGLHHETFTSLSTLDIRGCPNLVSLPNGELPTPNLSSFCISYCKNLRSLPEGMHTLTSLRELIIEVCPNLESFPEGGLPLNLTSLRIHSCAKLIARRMEWGLDRLASLRDFLIGWTLDGFESFPNEWLLPSSLITLRIYCFPNLKTLDGKGLQHLTSLQELRIWNCPALQCMSDEGLPPSLSFLRILNCPLLEQWCRRENKKDYPKLAAIPFIKINNEMFS